MTDGIVAARGPRDRAAAAAARWVARPLLAMPVPDAVLWGAFRAAFALSTPRRAPGLVVTHEHLEGGAARVAAPPGGGPTVMWIHGGAFVAGSPATHARLTDPMARHGLRVVAPAYPLAPAHPFPAAHDACLAAARALARHGPFALGGDSAGATLAASIVAPLLAEGVRPTRLALVAPAADLDPDRAAPPGAREMLLSRRLLLRLQRAYAAGADPTDPRLSPARARFDRPPPALIHVSEGELLEPDADALAARLREGGGSVRVVRGRGLPHAWHLAAGIMPAADRALADIAAFLRGAAT